MANKENLIPQAHVLTVEEASKGGKASGEARRKKANLKKAMERALATKYTVGDTELTGEEMLTINMLQIAASKSHNQAVAAYRAILQTVGIEDEALSRDLERAEELLGGITDVIE